MAPCLRYVYGHDLHKHPKLKDTMFRDRATQFVERLGWPLSVTPEGHERDQYDDLNPLYAIWEREDGTVTTRPPVVLTGFPHTVTISDHHISAGCKCRPPSVWLEHGEAFIRADGHEEEAEAWAAIINQLAAAHGCVDREEEAEA